MDSAELETGAALYDATQKVPTNGASWDDLLAFSRAKQAWDRWLNEHGTSIIASARQAQDNAKDARTLEDCVLDMCARIDVSGESAKLDTWEDAMDYFQTVSMNIGMARVHIERTRGPDYYGECYNKYKREDKEWADRRAAIAAATPGKGAK